MEVGAHSRPVIVTGTSGIAGLHLLQALGDRQIDAIGVSRATGTGALTADLTDAGAVARLPLAAGVIHAAGLTPHRGRGSWQSFRDANVGTTELLATEAAARGARFFVYLSTAGVYSRQSRTATGRFYVVSKLLAERRLRQLVGGRIPLWILRPASLYGEYDSGSVARLIRAAARGRVLLPGGSQRKCLLYAGALAQVITSEIATGLRSGIRTEAISDVRAYALTEIIAAIELSLGRRVTALGLPAGLLSPALAAAGSFASATRVNRLQDLVETTRVTLRDVPCPPGNALLRHPAAQVSLTEGIRREIHWLRSAGRV